MTNKANRYIMLYSQTNGTPNNKGTEIWLDRETGISYLFRYAGYEEYFTPLLDEKGRPVVMHMNKDAKRDFPWDGKRVS